MARRPRPNLSGAFYHVLQRGNYRQNLFLSEPDYLRFLRNLEKYRDAFDYRVHAYCLMTNHVHLLLETRQANLSRILQRLMGAYTLYYNRKRKKVGHLFQGRTKTLLVETREYLLRLSRYIHLNPVMAGMVPRPEDYPWSSMSCYLPRAKGPEWVTTDRTLHYVQGDRPAYVKYVYEGTKEMWEPDPLEQLFLGGKAFIERMKSRLGWSGTATAVPRRSRSATDDPSRPARILRKVAASHRLRPLDLTIPRRREPAVVQARQEAMYLLRTCTPLTLSGIGRLLGGVSHAAVTRCVRGVLESPLRLKQVDGMRTRI